MAKDHSLTSFFFGRVVLRHPKIIILCLFAIVAFLTFQARHFRLDASADTLILDDDEDLRYSRLINSRYAMEEFLVLVYTNGGDLFSDESLESLANLRDDLTALESVSSVTSILDVPLLESPAVPIKELSNELPTLSLPSVDMEMAKIELSNSPLYRNLMLSSDLKTTILMINFSAGHVDSNSQASGDQSDQAGLTRVDENSHRAKDKFRNQRHQDIVAIRAIKDKYLDDADIFLGGVGMIADDMITFIKNDLKVFSIGVLLLLVIILGIIFRSKRWIFLPMLCCFVSTISMVGLLGWFGWEVTVISSNFISLQLIMTLAIAIHLIVRYREMLAQCPQAPNHQLILDTVCIKLRPCVYAALTTIVGFGSLLFSGILPVRTFGWMMIAGLIVSLIVTFLLFPTCLILMPKEKSKLRHETSLSRSLSVTKNLAIFTEVKGRLIVAASGVVLIVSIIGISKLSVENSFIDYFKKDTEIYQGMKMIDQRLCGTTSMDIVMDFDDSEDMSSEAETVVDEGDDIFDEFDEFGEFDEFAAGATDGKYWFTPEKMKRIKAVHRYLDSLPESGKVMSLAAPMEIAEKLKGGDPLDSLELALLFRETPEEFKVKLIDPYVSVEHGQARFSLLVRDSEKDLRRNAFLNKIKSDLPGVAMLDAEKVHVAGVFVLYNNMLQSLFSSQVKTLGVTVLLLMGMFLFLFRSVKLSLIAMLVNLLPIAVVLGVMGLLGIPLDMMTITIAAISLGIAVDDTIHYIHRFKQEFKKEGKYLPTMHLCHGSVGHAMQYTSVTIIVGFSILALSNFIPSIYFGLLTGLAMFIALIVALTLLPRMLIQWQAFGKEM